MHEKTNSIEKKLPIKIVKKIRFIASIRNKAVHENVINVDLNTFKQQAQDVINYLKSMTSSTEQEKQPKTTSKKQCNDKYENSVEWKNMSTLEKITTVASIGALAFGAYIKAKDFLRRN
ncbi:hypothetical protein MLM31_23435 [Escherichia coli]|uniref:hypothetical protein n=1 Tax=Escherichia fergusonii TaxID=564 RepID=UPI001B9926E8|nr:hypothetical protein [Escherichia coli]MCN2839869.1 hypothetical protein [Escherichia coli]MCN7828371.1 hypothetical protein [Escherichia coli]HBC9112873.1 hypothetical protein [Escherichia coli]